MEVNQVTWNDNPCISNSAASLDGRAVPRCKRSGCERELGRGQKSYCSRRCRDVAAKALRRPKTEETKRRIRMGLIGHLVSEATKDKIRAVKKGRKHSEHARQLISASLRGKKRQSLSEYHRLKLQLAHFGKPLSSDHRRKIALGQLRRSIASQALGQIELTATKSLTASAAPEWARLVQTVFGILLDSPALVEGQRYDFQWGDQLFLIEESARHIQWGWKKLERAESKTARSHGYRLHRFVIDSVGDVPESVYGSFDELDKAVEAGYRAFLRLDQNKTERTY